MLRDTKTNTHQHVHIIPKLSTLSHIPTIHTQPQQTTHTTPHKNINNYSHKYKQTQNDQPTIKQPKRSHAQKIKKSK